MYYCFHIKQKACLHISRVNFSNNTLYLFFIELIASYIWEGNYHKLFHHIPLFLPFFSAQIKERERDAATATKSLQSCLTLCDPGDGSPPGSSVPGINQARILEWVAISFSNACMHAEALQSRLTLWDPMDSSPPNSLSTGFSRQEYWSGLPFLLLREQ